MSTTRALRPPSSSTISTEFAKRARAAHWRRRRPFLVGLAVVLVVLAVAAYLYTGPLLVVRHVTVSGVSGQRLSQVREASEVPLGASLGMVDAGAVESRVRALPFVAAVSVHRSWPSTIRLEVVARMVAAVVPADDGGYQVVDPDGVPFGPVRRRPKAVPLVRVGLGESERPALQAALAVLAALPTDVRRTVTGVAAESPDDVRLTVGNRTVIWGSPDRSERKVRVYTVLRRTPATMYDLSSPDTPVLR